jgi:Ni/Fe-hydrogenase subunit HybB-like protein
VIVKWQRGVPVYGVPVITGAFLATAAIAGLGLVLMGYREAAGLGPASGLNDAYAWGIWKTFNTMVLTALGSGSFAIGIAAWIFKRRALHSVMRTALLISFLVYTAGILAILVDAGRPWNMWNIILPWHWNLESALWEVALCMPTYAFFPLLLENTPPLLERWYYLHPALRRPIRNLLPIIRASYPWVVALAYVLPIMHQSSLGALMLVAGTRVHPLWQTPLLPFFYVWAAAFIGTATVMVTLLLSHLAWKRSLDFPVLGAVASLASGLAMWWLGIRLLDIFVRGQVLAALRFDWYALVFWIETLTIGGAVIALRRRSVLESPYHLFLASLSLIAGGMIYRYAPPALAFTAEPLAWYTPSVIEILVSLGFIAFCHLGFLIAVKRLPILPAPVADWYDLVDYYRHLYPWVQRSQRTESDHATSEHRPSYAN